jgi:hypothetical protein
MGRDGQITLELRNITSRRQGVLKAARAFPVPTIPSPAPRYEYGPSWEVRSFLVGDDVLPARVLGREEFMLHAGFAKGSCPYLFLYDAELDLWLFKGSILKDAIGVEARRTDGRELDTRYPRIQILEQEAEISYIDYVRLHIRHYVANALPVPPRYLVARASGLLCACPHRPGSGNPIGAPRVSQSSSSKPLKMWKTPATRQSVSKMLSPRPRISPSIRMTWPVGAITEPRSTPFS